MRPTDDPVSSPRVGNSEQPERVAQREALASPAGRRWLRKAVLPELPTATAQSLADQLLAFHDDFLVFRWDPTLATVVQRASLPALLAALEQLAASSAAEALWRRLTAEGIPILVTAALRLLRRGTVPARESVLVRLVVDPAREPRLPRWAERLLLVVALADPAAELRGLAVETASQRFPDLIRPHWRRWIMDESERARRAAWLTGLGSDPTAGEFAERLLQDENVPADRRASALWALAQVQTTAAIAPWLAWAIASPAADLAFTAADLLWTRHRHPLPAQAALESPYAEIRALGAQLLDPRRGSPAAGGARPGMPLPW